MFEHHLSADAVYPTETFPIDAALRKQRRLQRLPEVKSSRRPNQGCSFVANHEAAKTHHNSAETKAEQQLGLQPGKKHLSSASILIRQRLFEPCADDQRSNSR
jgi:hypothetical protein